MIKKLEKNIQLSNNLVHDVWDLTYDGEPVGSYFAPKDVSGQEYEDAMQSAKDKLIVLGLTELEVDAIVGRQLF
jgi:hypothetical protein